VIPAILLAVYLIEFAVSADPAAGIAVLGSQGDPWDAQKDMLADTLGAISATLLYFALNKEVRPC
jgi:putative membrane protein